MGGSHGMYFAADAGGGIAGVSGNLSGMLGKMYTLGGNWDNIGGSFLDGNGINLDYSGKYLSLNVNYAEGGIGERVIEVPEVVLSGGSPLVWALQLRNHVNAFMQGWNAQYTASFSDRVGDQVLPPKVTALGKFWSFISPRTWNEGGLSYTVNYEGIATGIAPIIGDVPLSGPGLKGIIKAELATEKGAFSVFDWAGYPTSLPKPTGPFKLLEGAEYDAARKAANNANRLLHKANPEFKGLQIHEIHPVKFGGDPTNPLNKALLTPQEHRLYNRFWFKLQNSIKK